MLSRQWRRATTHSDWVLDLTPDRGSELKQRLQAVIEEYMDDQPADGTAQVMLQLHLFPRPGTIVGADA
jgi:hypothetical protein